MSAITWPYLQVSVLRLDGKALDAILTVAALTMVLAEF